MPRNLVLCFIYGIFIGLICGWIAGNKNGESSCVVGYDSPPAKCYFADGSMTIWFGSEFTLAPGESTTIDIPITLPSEEL
jgi:hypothetical protein